MTTVADAQATIQTLEAENRLLRERLDAMSAEMAQLRAVVAELREENAALRAENAALREENAALASRVSELESQVKTNSRNSSLPPSSDGPQEDGRTGSREGGRRKRGGQKGHRGHSRARAKLEDADKVEHVFPGACEKCGTSLEDEPTVGEPKGQPVYDLPEPATILTWWWLHSRRCPNPKCGHVNQARAPNAVGQSPFGRNLHTLCSILVGRCHLSRRLVTELLTVIYNIHIAASTLSNMEKRTSAALADPVEQAREHLRSTDLLHCDETGWREALQKAWMWVFASPEVSCFTIDPSRGGKVVRGMIGEDYAGTLVVDRWPAYGGYTRAFCWAHLLRDFRAMIERHHSPWHGRRLEILAHRALDLRARFDRGEILWTQLVADSTPLRAEFEQVLSWTAANAPGAKARGIAAQLVKHFDCLWRFLEDEQIPPTNNYAERLIRPAVILRKLNQGTDSIAGSRFLERLLTVITSLRLQDRDVFKFIGQALAAHADNTSPPSLIPVASVDT